MPKVAIMTRSEFKDLVRMANEEAVKAHRAARRAKLAKHLKNKSKESK
jgi:hypothetical protein